MSFKEQHPSYKTYESPDFFVNKLPSGFAAALQGFVTRHCDHADTLKVVINDMASRIPDQPTMNWGWDYLLQDLSYYTTKLCNSSMHKVMDFLEWLYGYNSPSMKAEDFNEFLEEQKVGYIFNASFPTPFWELRASVTARTEAVDDASHHIKDVCQQALEHLNQAKKHLTETKTDRDRKDAVRDCLSAMEAMLKELSNETDIKAATAKLRGEKVWGPDIVVKDGLSLWDRMHELYPDMRHGNPKKSDITDQEALYWADRIMCFIRYMSRVYNR